MKKVKKPLSLLLTFVMTLTVLCGMFVGSKIETSASTGGKTAQQALQWVKDREGKKVGEGQCVSLTRDYISYLGNTFYGWAYQYRTKEPLPNGWRRIQGAQPKLGDILIYTDTSGSESHPGHVAIYESDYVTWHQNYSGFYVQKVTNKKYNQIKASDGSPYWGVIRPDFKSSSTQNPIVGTPIITSDKDLYEYGETVVLKRNTVQNTNFYWIVMYHYDTQIISSSFDYGTYVLNNLDMGWYTAYLQVGNSTSGTITSEAYKFYVQKRLDGTPVISTDKEFYAYGENVTLRRNTVNHTNYYWLGVALNGKQILSQSMDDSTYTLSNLSPGAYSTYLSVGNGISGRKTSADHWFYVYSYGWNKFNSHWYYCTDNGPVKGWKYIDNNWYYLDPTSGIMQTGWLQLGGKWYYLNSSGAMVTGWGSIGGKWYYFNNSGAMQTGWLQLGGKWYYLNSSGAMVTGWGYIDGKWYYFNGSGAMQTGWIQLSGKWYYLNSSGAMVTGWQQIGGKWYYFNSSGAMATGWIQLSGKWYYLNSSGAMVTGTQRINGKTYRFNSSGVWIA